MPQIYLCQDPATPPADDATPQPGSEDEVANAAGPMTKVNMAEIKMDAWAERKHFLTGWPNGANPWGPFLEAYIFSRKIKLILIFITWPEMDETNPCSVFFGMSE